MTAAAARVVLLAGASGSGKSRLAARAGCPRLNLDDFYRDGDHPGLPRTLGIVDWDDPATWDVEAAVAAVARLCREGRAPIPVYDLAASRRVGWTTLELPPGATLVAEGVFAPEAVAPCRDAGLPVTAVYLDRSRTATALRRLLRDVAERRKPLPVLLRRGLALWRAEPAIRARALARGCRPLGRRATESLLRGRGDAPRAASCGARGIPVGP